MEHINWVVYDINVRIWFLTYLFLVLFVVYALGMGYILYRGYNIQQQIQQIVQYINNTSKTTTTTNNASVSKKET